MAGTVSNVALLVREAADVTVPATMTHIVLGAIAYEFLVVHFLAFGVVDFDVTVRAGVVGHFERMIGGLRDGLDEPELNVIRCFNLLRSPPTSKCK